MKPRVFVEWIPLKKKEMQVFERVKPSLESLSASLTHCSSPARENEGGHLLSKVLSAPVRTCPELRQLWCLSGYLEPLSIWQCWETPVRDPVGMEKAQARNTDLGQALCC